MKIRYLIERVIREEAHVLMFCCCFTVVFYFLYKYIITRYIHLVPYLIIFSIPFLLAMTIVMILTPFIIFIARWTNIIDKTVISQEGKFPTPLLGGIAIYVSFVIVSVLCGPMYPELGSMLVAGTIIFILGTIDDVFPLSSFIRLGGQIIASFIVMSSGLMVSFMPHTPLGITIACLITLLWILGIINSVNFFDGADGLATGITFISSMFFSLITLHLKQYHVCLPSVILCGCCAGFFIFNFKPAKIYLGDGGSTFLGFILACLALYGGWSDRHPVVALGIPTLILGVLIFDMVYITISRISTGKVKTFREWLDYTGRDHFHHRLMDLGFTERNAVLFIFITCLTLGLGALQLEKAQTSYPVVIQIIQAVFIFFVITLLMLTGREKVNKIGKV